MQIIFIFTDNTLHKLLNVYVCTQLEAPTTWYPVRWVPSLGERWGSVSIWGPPTLEPCTSWGPSSSSWWETSSVLVSQSVTVSVRVSALSFLRYIGISFMSIVHWRMLSIKEPVLKHFGDWLNPIFPFQSAIVYLTAALNRLKMTCIAITSIS